MNRVYLYDGTFKNLLDLILVLIEHKIVPFNIYEREKYQPNLLEEVVDLKLDESQIEMSYLFIRPCYYVYLSNFKKKELLIYHFIYLALKYGKSVFAHEHLEAVNLTLKVSKNVSREAHKLKGFLRFKQIEDKFYYATFSSTNNVISILAAHFKKRLNEPWLIYDEGRQIYAFYDLKQVVYGKGNLSLNLILDESENNYEDLFRTFFKTIAIKERENKKCQQNFMPKKYWKNLIEMEDL